LRESYLIFASFGSLRSKQYNVDVYTQKYCDQYAQTCYVSFSFFVFTLNDLIQKIRWKRLNYCGGKGLTTR